jgi:hypothetical protein
VRARSFIRRALSLCACFCVDAFWITKTSLFLGAKRYERTIALARARKYEYDCTERCSASVLASAATTIAPRSSRRVHFAPRVFIVFGKKWITDEHRRSSSSSLPPRDVVDDESERREGERR